VAPDDDVVFLVEPINRAGNPVILTVRGWRYKDGMGGRIRSLGFGAGDDWTISAHGRFQEMRKDS
jgi:hypothetical protein